MAETTPLQLACYTLLCVLVVTIVLKLKLKLRPASAGRLNLPPGPWALPVIGHMHFLLGALPHQAMRGLARRHGPVMLLRLGHVPTLVLSSEEAAREVMKVHDAAFANRPVYATADVLTYGGQNISFARLDSRHWKTVRKLCAVELLSPKRVRSFRPIREEEAARLVRSVADAGAGATVNVSERVKVMMNDVIMRVSVGDRCQQRALYLEELDRGMGVLSGFNLTDLFPTSRLARALGGGSLRAAWEVRERIQSILDAMIVDHKRAMETEEADAASAGHESEDILTTLLRFQRDGGTGGITLTNENVNGVLFDIFSAGSETTATTTIWAMSELIRNPRTMTIAQSEVRQALQGKTKVAEADIDGQLHYLQMVIKETFRLHPPVPLLLPRLCTKQSKIMGYDVPPGTTVFVNMWAIGRDEMNWTDASEFKPERFRVEKVDYGGTDFRFLPGGAGRRMCPGMMFGVSNIEIALASLLYHFDWRLPDGASLKKLDMTEAYGITTRRKTNLLLEASVFVP
ncbi:dolabradiene monooxygenase-like [Hordeum vulgare subsp. vulgare]|uniref:dolabradiene monooxygenase-like n=1 Tax=Hordeum vulgare subsp. vulgare TaxID=112509 RepID=UPI000296C877|nr:dolabradiene monooxygenase-like [Hordeum vulgare subsp. vulgare]